MCHWSLLPENMDEQHNMVVTMLEAMSMRKETYERTYSLPTFPNLGLLPIWR